MTDTADVHEDDVRTEQWDADSEDRHRRIAEAAYYRAQQRGFAPGYEEEDWLAAEQEIGSGAGTEFHAEDNDFPSPK